MSLVKREFFSAVRVLDSDLGIKFEFEYDPDQYAIDTSDEEFKKSVILFTKDIAARTNIEFHNNGKA